MTVHEIRALLAADKATVGTWLQLPSPDVAELMARAGYDWVAVDMEHGSFGRTGLPTSFGPLNAVGPRPSPVWARPAKRRSNLPWKPARRALSFP